MLYISTGRHQQGCPSIFTVNKDAMLKDAARGVKPPIVRADCDKMRGDTDGCCNAQMLPGISDSPGCNNNFAAATVVAVLAQVYPLPQAQV